jgi:biopolymer transport protein ExbD
MKFPRNARIFRGQLDAAPLASVFFLLVMFVLLSSLVYTPGVRMRIQLPVADGLPGVEGPTIAVAVDRSGRYYFENQMIAGSDLSSRLRLAAKSSPQPLTLLVRADRETTREMLDHLALLARAAGIYDLMLATLPRVFEQPLDPPQN